MTRWIRGAVVAVSVFSACTEVPQPPGKALQSSRQRITAAPDAADFAATIDGNTATALALYAQLVEGDENFFFSPHSIISALGLAYGGAANASKSELEQFLRANASFHRSRNELDRQLASRGSDSQGAAGEPFALRTVNQFFVADGFPVESGYLDLLQQEYGLGLRALDFEKKPADARRAINGWIDAVTNGHIPELLSAEEIDTDTRFVIANAMYMSAGWPQNFGETTTEPFTGLGGLTTAPLMRNRQLSARELETTELQAVELDYSGNELALVLIMPKGDYRAWEATLSPATLADVEQRLTGQALDLSMPKWELRSKRDLPPALIALGVTSIFDGERADFSAMTSERLYVSFIKHEAWLDVSESGTRAAAATAVGGTRLVSLPPETKRVVIDRPFFYFVKDKATKAVLFAGRYLKPS